MPAKPYILISTLLRHRPITLPSELCRLSITRPSNGDFQTLSDFCYNITYTKRAFLLQTTNYWSQPCLHVVSVRLLVSSLLLNLQNVAADPFLRGYFDLREFVCVSLTYYLRYVIVPI